MKLSKVFVTMALLILLLAPLASAQDQPAQFLQLLELNVKSGAVPAFEDYVKKIAEAYSKTGTEPQWGAFQVTMGGKGSTYMVAFLFDKWGDVDSWGQLRPTLMKAFGEVEGAKIYRTGSATVESSSDKVYTLLPEHSTNLKAYSTLANNYLVVETDVKPDMMSQYETYLSSRRAAGEAMEGSPMAIRRRSLLGGSGTYITSLPAEKLGDIDGWPSPGQAMRKMYGDEGASQLRELSRSCIKSRRIMILTLRPDLSWWATPTPTSE